jgi:hypothetical protein
VLPGGETEITSAGRVERRLRGVAPVVGVWRKPDWFAVTGEQCFVVRLSARLAQVAEAAEEPAHDTVRTGQALVLLVLRLGQAGAPVRHLSVCSFRAKARQRRCLFVICPDEHGASPSVRACSIWVA